MPEHLHEAAELVAKASADTVEYMRRCGWHQCTEVLDEPQAVIALADQLGDRDYSVVATRTCAGFIVWICFKDD